MLTVDDSLLVPTPMRSLRVPMRSLLVAGLLIAIGLLVQALGGGTRADAPPMHPAMHAPAGSPAFAPAGRG